MMLMALALALLVMLVHITASGTGMEGWTFMQQFQPF
jgi:hypothetical protein